MLDDATETLKLRDTHSCDSVQNNAVCRYVQECEDGGKKKKVLCVTDFSLTFGSMESGALSSTWGEKKKKKISLELKNKTKHADKLQMSNLKKGYFQTVLTVTRPVSKNV